MKYREKYREKEGLMEREIKTEETDQEAIEYGGMIEKEKLLYSEAQKREIRDC